MKDFGKFIVRFRILIFVLSILLLIPAGYAMLSGKASDGSYPNAQFQGNNQYAIFWTADTAEEEGMAYYRYIICDQPEFMLGKGDITSFGATVRCVR